MSDIQTLYYLEVVKRDGTSEYSGEFSRRRESIPRRRSGSVPQGRANRGCKGGRRDQGNRLAGANGGLTLAAHAGGFARRSCHPLRYRTYRWI